MSATPSQDEARDRALGRLLLEAGRLTRETVEHALVAARVHPGGLVALLVQRGLVSQGELEQVFVPTLAPPGPSDPWAATASADDAKGVAPVIILYMITPHE